MRQLAWCASALLMFVVSFGAIYLSFRSSTPALRGAVGGGFFLCVALLLLWKDFALVSIPKAEFGLGPADVAGRALDQVPVVQHQSSPRLASGLPSNATADAPPEALEPVMPQAVQSALRPERRDDCDMPSNRAA
jgi:hypothetical protein